jgi:hypothetical protein
VNPSVRDWLLFAGVVIAAFIVAPATIVGMPLIGRRRGSS